MGYTTLKGGKIVIWTSKVFVADDYPFNQEGENHTYFFKNLKGIRFTTCLSRLTESEKIAHVAKILDMPEDKIVLKSRKSHFNPK